MSEISEVGEAPKRFRLSNQELAKERVAVIKEEVKTLQKSHPEALSFCIFGSQTTGTARPESDIDGYLFVDVVKAAEARHLSPDEILETQKNKDSETPTTYLTDEVASEYISPLREVFKEKLSLSDEQVAHVRSRPISREIIDEHLGSLLEQIKKLEEYKKAVEKRELNNPFDKPGHTVEEIEAYIESRPQHPPFPYSGTNLSAMFHLDIGGGIGEYRQYLLDKLSRIGQTGEKAWRVIIEGTEEMEQHLRSDTEVSYPRTLEQARQVYGTSINNPDSVEGKEAE